VVPVAGIREGKPPDWPNLRSNFVLVMPERFPTASPSSRKIAVLSCLYFLPYQARITEPAIKPIKKKMGKILSSIIKPPDDYSIFKSGSNKGQRCKDR
jgi:hypothetical protein